MYTNDNPISFVDQSGFIATVAEQNVDDIILTILATLVLAAVAVNNFQNNDIKETFYRGTSAYDVDETIYMQHIDLQRIIDSQRRNGYPEDRQGVYFSTQLFTAEYYASLVGRDGKRGGPGVFAAEVPERRFFLFVAKYGIAVEVPVPQPPVPGQTETRIPYRAIPEFETFARYFRVE